MTNFGTKVCDLSDKSHTRHLSEQMTSMTEMRRTVELDAEDVALLDSVGFTTAYDTRDDKTILIAAGHDNDVHLTEQFDTVEYVDDNYVPGTEILL